MVNVWLVDATPQADGDIKEIVRFYLDKEGPEIAQGILNRITKAKNDLQTLPDRGRIPPELKRMGVFAYREIQIPPYRMFYEVNELDSKVYVHLVVDGRRDLPDLLAERLLGVLPGDEAL